MKSINFDDGLQSFCINGDENRVIRFNPADLNLVIRAQEAEKQIEAGQKDLEAIEAIELNPDGTPMTNEEDVLKKLEAFNGTIREALNHIFNADVYDTAFAGQSPLCIVGENKEFLFEAFVKSVLPFIENEVNQYEGAAAAAQARIEKYTKGYVK